MKLYSNQHLIDSHSNYGNVMVGANPLLAQTIHRNFDTMGEEEMKHIVLKCLDNKTIKHELLKFELNNLTLDTKQISLKNFVKEVKRYLIRYHWKAGGFLLEDSEWRVYRKNCSRHEILANHVLFENSLDYSDKEDRDTIVYLEAIVRLLNQISDTIKVNYEFVDEDNDDMKIVWVLLRVVDTEKNEKCNKSKITL